MPKKYIQLFLSINFCLSATTAIANQEGNDDASFVVIPNEESDEIQLSIKDELTGQFYHIWHRLEKINTIHPTDLLQRLISKHQQNAKNPTQYEESKLDQEALAQYLTDQFTSLNKDLQIFSESQSRKELLDTQLIEIRKCVDNIHRLYKERTLSRNDQLFLKSQLEELLIFLQDFFAGHYTNTAEIDRQINQIWDYLNEINKFYRSELSQELISQDRSIEIPYDESVEEVSKEVLENQLLQLRESLKAYSQYQPKEELDEEDSKDKLDIQFDEIGYCLDTIHGLYDLAKESLSKKEKASLAKKFQKLQNFFHNFASENSLHDEENSYEDGLGSLDEISMLLGNCKEEDSLIYPQYEYIINSQEAKITDLLASSQNIENRYLSFNKAEGLIEIQHAETLEDDEHQIEPYVTTWKIRSADANLVKDWEENDSITIDKTGIFSKFSIYGEKLEYTLKNSNKSVRANFVCKSSSQNTYTILAIDYHDKVVVLENGPCLFVQSGDLKEWHVKDTVVLQRSGSVTHANSSHELINKTRNKTNTVSLKQ